MTEKVSAHEVDAYYQLGVIGLIPKPFNPRRLVSSDMDFWNKYHE